MVFIVSFEKRPCCLHPHLMAVSLSSSHSYVQMCGHVSMWDDREKERRRNIKERERGMYFFLSCPSSLSVH